MELSVTHFELSAVLSKSVAYQEMKCITECKMAASYVSELKRLLKQNFQTTPRTRIIQLLLLRKAMNHPLRCNLDYSDSPLIRVELAILQTNAEMQRATR